MTAPELKSLLDGSWTGTVLHLTPEDHYAAGHIPGARPACVYEVSFLDQVAATGATLETPLVLCGPSTRPFTAETAAEKLRAVGYRDLSILEGGLEAWRAAGYAVEGNTPPASPSPRDYDGDYVLNTAESVIRWTGRNLFNHHEGTLRLAGGSATIANGQPTAASFTIDMRSIACADLADSALNAMLLRHLADDDFFATERFPTAGFFLGSVRELPGTPNYEFTGLLQLRGVTQEITFPVTVAPNGPTRISAQAQFEIDRTRWGVLYGSSRFYDFLGKHLVNDAIHLHLKIHLDRSALEVAKPPAAR
jgi:polyisoprenoid-binding protein YceI